jgi:glycosyltransferase involved in cell wall biosynthesis
LKVAIIHDWLVTNAGAEGVLKSIIELYPDADVFSLVDFLTPEDREEILKGKFAKTSFIQKLPFAKKQFRNYLPLFPKAIESLDVSGYDLIISSSHAVAKGVKKSKDQLHVCYSHTPIRYAWDMYEEYTKDLPFLKKILVQMSLAYIRKWDIASLDRVDYFIANSHFIADRIKRIYDRDSVVINPPVDTEKFTFSSKKEDFYLTASRLVPYKKTRLIVEAFNKTDKKLVVIGKGEELETIKKIANSNIEVLGFVETDEMISYMQRAKGFVFASLEDFGIIPIEAMSCGTPVLAYGKGGIRDSVVDGKTGIFFDEQSVESILKSLEIFDKKSFDYKEIALHANLFNIDRFKEEFKIYLNLYLK